LLSVCGVHHAYEEVKYQEAPAYVAGHRARHPV
jgi:hypothetical protein